MAMGEAGDFAVLARLAATIEARKDADPKSSYVASLFARGDDAILKKIGEEATETVMAAKDGDKIRIAAEVRVRVIAIEAGKTLLLERDAIIDLARRAKISIVAR